MQTFLPYKSFKESFKTLDYRRLGKQRVEAHQILNVLLERTDTKGWRNHPITKMWAGYEDALKMYIESLSYYPTHYELRVAIGRTQRLLGNHRESIRIFEDLLKSSPISAYKNFELAKSYYAALIGISIDRGEIGSLDDKVLNYLEYLM